MVTGAAGSAVVTGLDGSRRVVKRIWTIGHWTCSESAFIDRLSGQQIELLVDVRAHPGSRRSPHFARDAMPQWLHRADIHYAHIPDLGGRRRKQSSAGLVNDGWQNASFKNYADYSLTASYQHAITALTDLAQGRRTVIMCSEPMPWRCHRLLISNTLTAGGWSVQHIMSGAVPREHVLGQWGATPSMDAHGQLTYPAQRDPEQGRNRAGLAIGASP